MADIHIARGGAAAAENIFDVDDGIVDDHAERDHETADRHGVRLNPAASRIHTVVSRASGIALKDTNAPRQSRKVINKSATTSTAPIAREFRSFSIALSMKLAGRSSAGWYCTPCLASAGASASSLSSSARVTSRVLAPNWVEVSMRMPG